MWRPFAPAIARGGREVSSNYGRDPGSLQGPGGIGGPREDARYLLPNACVPTQLMMTMNARSLLNFLNSAVAGGGAQWEINRPAWKIRPLAGGGAAYLCSPPALVCLVREVLGGRAYLWAADTWEEAERLG